MRLERLPPDDTSSLLDIARQLVAEYAALPHTVGRWFTAAEDIAALPAPFIPPQGAMFIAMDEGEALGCGVVIALDLSGVAEIKRLYVRPSARGRGVGETVTRALLAEAVALGFHTVRLDTAPELTTATALYRKLGFQPIPRYKEGQLPDALCFELKLQSTGLGT